MMTSDQSVICLTCDGKLSEFSEFRAEVLRLISESVFVKSEVETLVKFEYESDCDTYEPILDEFLIDKEEYEDNYENQRDDQVRARKSTSKKKAEDTEDVNEKSQLLFSCESCVDKSYGTNWALERHMAAMHGYKKSKKSKRYPDENMCTICAKILKNGKKGLESHVSSANFQPFVPYFRKLSTICTLYSSANFDNNRCRFPLLLLIIT
jgi:hypothetical protein